MNNAAMAGRRVAALRARHARLQALKQSARQGASADTLKSAARQFEAVFTQMVLKSMRDATPQDGVFDNEQTKLYMSMFDQQLSSSCRRAASAADVMVRQLARAAGSALAPDAAARQPPACRAGRARRPPGSGAAQGPAGDAGCAGQPVRPAGRWRGTTLGRGCPPKVGTVVPGAVWNPTAGVRQYRAQEAIPAGRQRHRELRQRRRTGPCERLPAAHERAGANRQRTSGVPAQLILGGPRWSPAGGGARSPTRMAAPPTTCSASRPARTGAAVAEITTTEYVDGQPQKVKARFRAYGSYEEAFADYARLLTSNPRYAGVVGANFPRPRAACSRPATPPIRSTARSWCGS